MIGPIIRGLWKLAGGASLAELRAANTPRRMGWESASLRQQNLSALQGLMETANKLQNTFVHSISVACKGGPGADLRRIYYLALAAAFGRRKGAVTTTIQQTFKSHWDVTGKMVNVTIAYSCGWVSSVLRELSPAPQVTPIDVIQRGPDQVTIGDSWPRFLKTLTGLFHQTPVENTAVRGGMPVVLDGEPLERVIGTAVQPLPNANGLEQWRVSQDVLRTAPFVAESVLRPYIAVGNNNVLREIGQRNGGFLFVPSFKYTMQVLAPVGKSDRQEFTSGFLAGTVRLPDQNRVITTGELYNPLVQPPRPPVDGISRGGMIEATRAALLNPGFLPEHPRLTEVPVASTGLYVQKTGDDMVPIQGEWKRQAGTGILVNNPAGVIEIPGVPLLAEGLRPVLGGR